MKWYYQGIGGVPFVSRTAARRVRDITEKSIVLAQAAIAKHGPMPGYVRSLAAYERTLASARAYLGDTRSCPGGCQRG